ncbi:hypothetical protein [Mycobacterium shigaense]|uniref:Uncharacterized protein n=1 Tax=Mycobacterium shigaense TaxID=722731 RepID=A0A1Z4EC25_9MYCO|nr:hypothetical protein [Mycobacterium shigaense]MEA1124141.1 hypothetical protein [Mycobacterium shigaense]PRI17369.1 hypothetical protein B2J96_02060 [Mycobacterium shigaense]BAX90503.1 hypothetical protein MSG_00337 [Mycobacterium shigaense]
MVSPTIDISGSGRVSAGACLRYRLDVVAADAVDVVHAAGGWLYDRVMAGWEVTVLLPNDRNTRSLRILGVSMVDAESEFIEAALNSTSQTLAVSAAAFTVDARLRDKVRDALDNRLTEVALWGERWPLGVDRGLAAAQHLLSGAARRFKAAALAAAEIPCGAVGFTETLLCDASRSPGDSELIRLT